jgi:hypothetical protein
MRIRHAFEIISSRQHRLLGLLDRAAGEALHRGEARRDASLRWF